MRLFPSRLNRSLALALLLLAALPLQGRAERTHVVKSGETLSSIAAKYDLSIREIARANKLKDADLVRKGQKLLIPDKPASFQEHKVAKGESLDRIAKRYKVSVAEIRAFNELKNPNHIVPGQVLRIPLKGTVASSASKPASPVASTAPAPKPSSPAASSGPAPKPQPQPAASSRTLPPDIQAAIDAAKVQRGRWKHIVIHHSATDEGSGKGMDRYHREERHMENGLAYHFVIGNGEGMNAGEIYVGKRWTDQLDGGHLAIQALNANSLGICLVGNFEKSKPSAIQLDRLEALIRALLRKTGLPVSAVTTHQLIHKRHTKCPGKYFPTAEFLKRLKKP